MSAKNDDMVQRARADLAKRLGISGAEIKEQSVEDASFPDTALGASLKGEMSGQMITSGVRIRLQAEKLGSYEYRASGDQLRLYKFKGSNYRI